MRGKKIPIQLPNTGVLKRRKHSLWMRTAVIIVIILFAILQFHIISQSKTVAVRREKKRIVDGWWLNILFICVHFIESICSGRAEYCQRCGQRFDGGNLLDGASVPAQVPKSTNAKRNRQGYVYNYHSWAVRFVFGLRYVFGLLPAVVVNGTHQHQVVQPYQPPNITEILRCIKHYNDMQLVHNEDQFGPLENDSVIIVIQVKQSAVLKQMRIYYQFKFVLRAGSHSHHILAASNS